MSLAADAVEDPQGETRPRSRLFGHSALLYLSHYVVVCFKFAAGFLVARFLGPGLYGLRNVFGMAIEYESFAHLGTFDAMQREAPYARGKGDENLASQIVGTVFTANLIYSLAAAAVLTLVAFYLVSAGVAQIQIDFVVFMAIYILVNKLGDFLGARLVVEKNTLLLSRTRIVHGVTSALASVALVYAFGLRGLFVGLTVGALARVLFVLASGGRFPGWYLSPRLLGSLLKIGFPVMLIGLMFILLRSVDRIVIATMLPSEMLGYFGVATIVSGLVYLTITDVIKVVLLPRIMETLGRTGDPQQVKPFLTGPSFLISCLAPYLIGILVLAIHLPLRYVIPDYMRSLEVARILTLGAYFISVAGPALIVCVGLNRQLQLVGLTALAVLMDAGLSYGLIAAGWSIEGVALGTALTFMVFGSVVYGYALSRFDVSAGEYLRSFASIYGPFAYAMVLLALIERLFPLAGESFRSDMTWTTLRAVTFVVLFSLILIPLRRHPALARLRSLAS